jgi:hypothetical protein
MPHQIKEHVHQAIKNEDMRKAVRLMDCIREANELMTELPAVCVEVLRDELRKMTQDCAAGPQSELKRAFLEYTQTVLDDAKRRERPDALIMYGGRVKGS